MFVLQESKPTKQIEIRLRIEKREYTNNQRNHLFLREREERREDGLRGKEEYSELNENKACFLILIELDQQNFINRIERSSSPQSQQIERES